jgi:hypothetical protein
MKLELTYSKYLCRTSEGENMMLIISARHEIIIGRWEEAFGEISLYCGEYV